MSYETELKAAVHAVANACRLCMNVQSALVSAESMTKKDKSPVTVADFGAQAVICGELVNAFPDVPIAGEEDSSDLRTPEGETLSAQVLEYVSAIAPGATKDGILGAIDSGNYDGGPSGRFWTLDPIDGTKGFLRGEQYAVALALIEDGEVVLGVLGCPNLPLDLGDPARGTGCVLTAVKGGGAYMRPLEGGEAVRISASEISDPSLAPICESVESAHSSHDESGRVAEILGVGVPPLRIDSQCKYAVIARGDASIYLRLPTRKDYTEKIWDHAAGSLIVEEAGGKVTDVTGKKLDFSRGRTLSENKGVIGTNGLVHDRVLAAVKEVTGG
ncbi:MAG TPA: 3'(2'),5'-bisphosphate nucleotidase [Thermodesulfobacteriota bacterium]|nr:3'(2'),5'-bisphosphate nucleotidase [Thermodesulfobacteriota bacterium]